MEIIEGAQRDRRFSAGIVEEIQMGGEKRAILGPLDDA